MSIQIELDEDKAAMFLAIHAKLEDVNTNKQNLGIKRLEWFLLDDLARLMRGEQLDGYEGIKRVEPQEWTEKML